MFPRLVAKLLFLALLLAWLALPVQAQDVTCDPGDIAWVKETVNADVGHSTGATGGEYNNFAAPFGIQRVFDQACAGLDIRILAGVDNYGSASASWGSRDGGSGGQINIDTVDGTLALPISVTGYIDETTVGFATLDWTGIDFTSGFLLSSAQFYVFQYIHLKNSNNAVWSINSTSDTNIFYRCVGEGSTGLAADRVGFTSDSTSGNVFIEVRATGNAGGGMILAGGSRVYESEIDNNGNAGSSAGAVRSAGGGNIFERNIIRDNNGAGFAATTGATTFRHNTSTGNGSHGGHFTAASVAHLVEGNIFHANGGDGLLGTAANVFFATLRNNNYSGNTGADKNVTVAQLDLDDPADTTDPGFSAPSLQPASGTVDFTFTFPAGDTESTQNKGAAAEAGGGGGAAGPPPPIIFQD